MTFKKIGVNMLSIGALSFLSASQTFASEIGSLANTGISSGKIWSAVIAGALVIGLTAYAAFALFGYRKEYGL